MSDPIIIQSSMGEIWWLEWLEFGRDLLAVGVGAFLGYLFARWADREKSKEEIGRIKNHMINSISEELKVIEKALGDTSQPVDVTWNNTNRRFEGSYMMMSTPAFEAAVNSGNFTLLSTSLQTYLSTIYLTIQGCNIYTQEIVRFYTAPIYTTERAEGEANRLVSAMNGKLSELRKEIPEVLPELELEKV